MEGGILGEPTNGTRYRLDEHSRRLAEVEKACGRVAVLEERVAVLGTEVRGLKRALWSLVFTLLGGMLLFLFSAASGLIGVA